MQDHFPPRTLPPSGGYVTLGTLILAAAAALTIVLMSGCHATPSTPASSSGFVSSSADKATEDRLRREPTAFKPLQPFDEGFVVVDDPGPAN